MSEPSPAHADGANGVPLTTWAVWRSTVGLVLIVTVVRIIYVGWLSPYTLVEDEAHYWEWSRHLDWSYYSKGPGVAWAIALSTWLVGNTELGVRLPAVIACSLTALCVAGLAMDTTARRGAGLYAAACVLAAPFMLAAGMLMTIDMPYMACWAMACWAGWHAIERGRTGAWLLMAGAIGLGFLFKYTILLLVPGLIFYAIMRRRAVPPRALIGVIIVLLIALAPVIIWNAQRDWPTARHLLGHLGIRGGDQQSDGEPFSILWPIQFIGIQFALIGPALALALGVAWWWRSVRTFAAGGMLFILSCAVPIIAFYFAVSFVTEGEANWAIAGNLSLLALAGYGSSVASMREIDGHRVPASWRHVWRATAGVGIVGALLIARPDYMARLPLVGQYVPVHRVSGGPGIAHDVEQAVRALESETGQTPFIVTAHYGIASLLAFYMEGHPVIYCASAKLPKEGRKTQYDYWDSTDLDDLDNLGGRSAIIVGNPDQGWNVAFERITEPVRSPNEYEDDRFIMRGFNYRGFDKERQP